MKIGNSKSSSSKKLFGPLKLLGKLNAQFENSLLPALTSIRPSMCVPLQELIEIYNSMFFLQLNNFTAYLTEKDGKVSKILQDVQDYKDQLAKDSEKIFAWKAKVE